MPTLYKTIIVALVAAFIILFLGKTELRTKLRDMCDMHDFKYIAKMLDCDFCFSFWTCLVISIITFVITKDIDLLIIVCAPPITRYMLY